VAALPLSTALALVQNAAIETGIPDGEASIALSAQVHVDGTIDGDAFSNTMSAPLTFELNPLELYLEPEATGSGPTFPQLDSTHSGTVERVGQSPSTIGVFGHHLPVGAVRFIGAAGVALALLLTLFGLVRYLREGEHSEGTRALRRVARDLVPIASDPAETLRAVIDVATIEALVDLAERAEAPLLDFKHGVQHSYFAEIDDILYRFAAEAPAAQPALADVVDFEETPPTGESIPVEAVPADETPKATARPVPTLAEVLKAVKNEPSEKSKAKPVVDPAIVTAVSAAPTNREALSRLEAREANEGGAKVIPITKVVARTERTLLGSRGPQVSAETTPATQHDDAPPGSDAVLHVVATPDARDSAELGLNAWFIEEKHQEFVEDPSSVSEEWRKYFAEASAPSVPTRIKRRIAGPGGSGARRRRAKATEEDTHARDAG
jgi:hypothetical protein